MTVPSGRTLEVFITHQHNCRALPALDTYRAVTTCTVSEEGRVLGVGRAFCAWEDRFVRRDGVKLAVSRALNRAGVLKDDRKVVWDVILNHKDVPPPPPDDCPLIGVEVERARAACGRLGVEMVVGEPSRLRRWVLRVLRPGRPILSVAVSDGVVSKVLSLKES